MSRFGDDDAALHTDDEGPGGPLRIPAHKSMFEDRDDVVWNERFDPDELRLRADRVAGAFTDRGVTFAYDGEERPFPLDLVPRVIPAEEWDLIDRGVRRRALSRGDLRTAGTRVGAAANSLVRVLVRAIGEPGR
jgi:hypothetical protein